VSGATRDFDRAVVLGGAGFIGSHLCDALLDAGTAVVCVDNFCTGRRENIAHLTEAAGFELFDHDVTDPLPDLGPLDVVFHLASPASPAAYYRLPIQTLRAGSLGTEHGLQLAERYRARFVLASTSEVYGDPEVHPRPRTTSATSTPSGHAACTTRGSGSRRLWLLRTPGNAGHRSESLGSSTPTVLACSLTTAG
jgi:dTDP-glucose 4,6-dehydratase